MKKGLVAAIKKFLTRRFFGKYHCPFCGNKSDFFLEIGENFDVIAKKKIIGAGRRKAGCPYCNSTDRERLVYLYLKNEMKIFGSDRSKMILHIAPERNITKKLLRHFKGSYLCGDLFTSGYDYPKHVKNMDLQNLPFQGNKFDLVICNHVLEHVENDKKALRELHRVLKPGGNAILQVPIAECLETTIEDTNIRDPQEREQEFGQADHVRLYGKDYVTILKAAGFKVERLNRASRYLKYKINPKEDIFLASKPIYTTGF